MIIHKTSILEKKNKSVLWSTFHFMQRVEFTSTHYIIGTNHTKWLWPISFIKASGHLNKKKLIYIFHIPSFFFSNYFIEIWVEGSMCNNQTFTCQWFYLCKKLAHICRYTSVDSGFTAETIRYRAGRSDNTKQIIPKEVWERLCWVRHHPLQWRFRSSTDVGRDKNVCSLDWKHFTVTDYLYERVFLWYLSSEFGRIQHWI